jgi:hypothetical protein
MEVCLLWFIGAIIVGMAGSARGRSGFGWFLVAVLISPLLGLILVLVLPNRSISVAAQMVVPAIATAETAEATDRRCPECAEWILREA